MILKVVDPNVVISAVLGIGHTLRRYGWFDDYLIEEAIKDVKNG